MSEVKQNDLDYQISSQLAGEFGRGHNKELRGMVNFKTGKIWFEVLRHNEVVHAGGVLNIALARFNAIHK